MSAQREERRAPAAPVNPFDAWADLLPLWGRFASDADVSFYRDLAERHDRPWVELGIGYGRVARWIKPDFGVDASPVMLERASRHAPRTRLIESDLRAYALPSPAHFSYAPLNTFDGIVRDDVLHDVLVRVLDQTAPGGRMAFDAQLPDPALGPETRGVVRLSGMDRTLAIFVTHDLLDAASGALEITAFVDHLDAEGHVLTRRYFPPMPYRARSPERWEELLAATGWSVEARWGGFSGEPLGDVDGCQVWVARRPRRPVT